ncbi:3366_t:CDS:1, partial [Dentiscutata heterogama]
HRTTYSPLGLNAQSNDTNIYYLVLGDSFARGVFKLKDNKTPHAYSYADALYERLKETNPNLVLKKFARGGQTTETLISDQLKRATKFMKRNSGLIKLITITIGTNEFSGCTSKCNNRLHKIVYNLNNKIIPMLKKAGGEGVQYWATTYHNIRLNSNPLDDSLIKVYNENGVKVVDMRKIITNETACSYTYACDYHDKHPNINGSHAIADVIYNNLTLPL